MERPRGRLDYKAFPQGATCKSRMAEQLFGKQPGFSGF
jgi:hypothetical protein